MDQTMHYRYPPLSGETPNTHDQLSAISTLHGIRRLSPETWKNKEALSVLEELDRVSFNNVATPLLRNKDNIEEYKVRVARMLSECYYTTGNQSEAIQQANRADSLQSHYAQEQMNIRRKMISESLQNELLSTRLKVRRWRRNRHGSSSIS